MTKKPLTQNDPRHGRLSSYTNHGCRCSKCKRANASAHLQRKCGITLDEKDEMIRSQQGRCAACPDMLSDDVRLVHLDHDHASGAVRAVLCHGCNLALGCLQESPERIRGLLEYAERWAY